MELVFFIISSFVLFESVCGNGTTVNGLIPEGYNRFSAPVIDASPVSVYISCQILHIDKIQESTMEFRLLLFTIIVWKDPRLQLQKIASSIPVVFPGEKIENIWKPRLAFPNSKQGEKFDVGYGHAVLKVLPDLSLYQAARLNFLVNCAMELHDYPMDVQTCTFEISFMADTDKEAILKWMGEENSPYRNLGKSIHLRSVHLLSFEIQSVKSSKVTKAWVSGNFTTLIAEFTFVRRLTGNIMSVYIPTTLVVFLSWLSFWIDVKAAPARITLGVTSILALVTQIVQSRSFVPPADYLKALDLWLFICVLLVFASLVEYAFAYQYTLRNKEKPQIVGALSI